ncbi:MAG: hypothetical protein OXT63_06010 [Gemmatimonadota bacterium]|uniref:hypothetical protein n=1 Tax=Candidatus Palauibacter soopunensis TaxID=3056739 RepID=UPI0023947386|nr:hypothetical protein [Candidatus Palauibacter soopunensis]MDE2879181.1 hypothetical protein [Candidatus Palauibacter soopunensis]MDE2943747.1 hypothetical protein [Gemmatimonadota bacterium]
MASDKHDTGGPVKDRGRHYFDDPRRWKRLIAILIVICAVVVALDLVNFVQMRMGWPELRHPERDWEGFPEFYAVYGFLAYTAIVYTAKLLRKGVMRDEDYYDR